MTIHGNIDSVDIKVIGESWLDANLDNYEVGNLPIVEVLGFNEGRDTTNYKLPDLGNGLFGPGSLRDWTPGGDHGNSEDLGSIPASVTVKYRENGPIKRPSKRSAAHILRDLESNITPLLFAGLYQRMSAEAVTLMTNASIYGTAKTFSGTGALDTYAADQKPDVDINANLQPMVKWKSLGLSLECFMSFHVETAFARHPAYTGAGTGSAIASTLPREEFKRRFMAAHPQLDALHICNSVTDTARAGQTSAPLLIGNTLLWFGLVDRRQNRFDLRSQESLDAPDGAIAIARAFDPYIEQWSPSGSGVDMFAGRTEHGIYFPRANDAANKADFAHFYGADEIFTATPT